MKILVGSTNPIKINAVAEAFAHFSGGVLNRQDITAQGVIMALVPFLNPALFFPT